MSEQGTVHKPAPKNSTIPVKLLHDPQAKDGTIRLYAHMYWRYGQNKRNFEGQKSMAGYLRVTPATIGKRAKELEYLDWLVVVEKDYNPATGNYTTPHYHLFLSQSDCRKFREEYQPTEGEHVRPKPTADEVELRKSRKGAGRKGGNPDVYRANSGLDGGTNSSLDGQPNSSLDELFSSYPGEDAKASRKDSVAAKNAATVPALQNSKTEVVNWSDVKEHFHSETGTWDDGYVYIGRGGHIAGLKKSDWGNPFTMRPEGTDDLTDERARVVEQYRAWLSDPRRCKLYNRIFTELRGKKLVYFSASESYHGDVLADIANYPEAKPYTRWFIGVFDAFGLFMDDNGQAQLILRGMNPHVKLDPPLRDADELLALAEWRRTTQAPAVTVGTELVEAVNAWRAAQLHAPKALPKVSSTVDSDSIVQPKKPRPRDLIFDAIAEGSFGIHNGQLDQEDKTAGGRVGKIKKWLVKHKPDVTPEDIQRFYIWYDSEIEASRPRHAGKFSEHWLAWEGSLTPDAPATKYYTAPEQPPVSTPEEMAEKRRIMAEAMKKRDGGSNQ